MSDEPSREVSDNQPVALDRSSTWTPFESVESAFDFMNSVKPGLQQSAHGFQHMLTTMAFPLRDALKHLGLAVWHTAESLVQLSGGLVTTANSASHVATAFRDIHTLKVESRQIQRLKAQSAEAIKKAKETRRKEWAQRRQEFLYKILHPKAWIVYLLRRAAEVTFALVRGQPPI
eukprot:gnl/TRDRNA2_/TRDRNA2_171316_c6_seq1.p1 gnl/TRDRNA2_/TRDRNA2_171316_c6~~gnl/TRDRNA2_/TRDRNA2_171316_c6_seq1.p1  ORF type:complete len:189 (+),score=17.41 gnl/TRDRNA2_/TRDRNA2_171316_c6_seq1:44-568(+)